ncbi:phage tail spike protein [Heyndrickxia sporothermodurans]|uniref:phage tail spike protein n=1 Tax=Heyndrickxia sporothermodurans TaxID=46224 RepID=UPI0035E258E0
MFPILYAKDETSFIHNGLGVLSGAVSSVGEEELNGLFELKIEYDSDGFLADVIENDMIVKAKVNDKQDPQLFRIYAHEKSLENDNLIIYAQHITYDAAGNFVESLELDDVTTAQAMAAIQANLAYPSKITFSSSNTTTRSSTKLYRTNPLQMVAGIDGSILDHWGGEIERDNFRIVMHKRRGSDDGVLIAYKKNLTGLEAKFDTSKVITRIFPFKVIRDEETEKEQVITIPGKYIDSPNINKYPFIRILPVDYSEDESVTDQESLQAKASTYFNTGSKDLPTVTMEVEFEPLWDTEEYKDVAVLESVGMGDTVTVHHSKMGVDIKAHVVKIEYDTIAEKNRKVTIGDVQARFTDYFNQTKNDVENKVKQAHQTAQEAVQAANGKNTNFYGPNQPSNPKKDDLWFKVVDGEYTRTYRFDGIQWQLVVDMEVNSTKEEAKEARESADTAFNTANQASLSAQQAVTQASGAFEDAQKALQQASDALKTSNSFATRISDAEGNISTLTQVSQGLQTAVANKAESSVVTQLAGVVDLKLSKTDAANTYATQTQLTATASSLTSTISQSINDIQIGGRNLIKNSNFANELNSWRNWGTATGTRRLTDIADLAGFTKGFYFNATSTGQFGYAQDGISVIPDKQYVLSAWVRVTKGYGKIMVQEGNSTVGWTSTSYDVESIKGKWIRITHKFTTKDSNISVYVGQATTDNYFSADVTGLQLEQGNKETPWSPAPEDMATASQISQLSDAINLRVTKKDLINQINIDTTGILIQGKKLILDGDTTVTGTFKVDNANITSVDAGKINAGTLTAFDIVGSTIRGSTFTAEDKFTNNTISISTGSIDSQGESQKDKTKKYFARLNGGVFSSEIKTSNTQVDGYNKVTIQPDLILFEAGDSYGSGSPYKKSNFSISSGKAAGQTKLDMYIQAFGVDSPNLRLLASDDIILSSGPPSVIDLNGLLVRRGYDDLLTLYDRKTYKDGSYTDPVAKVRADIVGDLMAPTDGGDAYARTNFEFRVTDKASQGQATQNYKNIRAATHYTTNGTVESTNGSHLDLKNGSYGKIRIGKDSRSSYILSMEIYNRTYTYAANAYVTENGVLGRSTSARKYKIDEQPVSADLPYKLLNVVPKTWYDKNAVEAYADVLSKGLDVTKEDIPYIERIPGLVAEDVRDAGLDQYVIYGESKNGVREVEGLMYDRLWTLLIPIVRDQQEKINVLLEQNENLIIKNANLEERLAKLEVA